MSAAPLHAAVRRRDLPALERLLGTGLDPNALDDRGRPPLWYVITRDAVASIGRELVDDARAMVTSAGENNDALRLAGLLGVRDP